MHLLQPVYKRIVMSVFAASFIGCAFMLYSYNKINAKHKSLITSCASICIIPQEYSSINNESYENAIRFITQFQSTHPEEYNKENIQNFFLSSIHNTLNLDLSKKLIDFTVSNVEIHPSLINQKLNRVDCVISFSSNPIVVDKILQALANNQSPIQIQSFKLNHQVDKNTIFSEMKISLYTLNS